MGIKGNRNLNNIVLKGGRKPVNAATPVIETVATEVTKVAETPTSYLKTIVNNGYKLPFDITKPSPDFAYLNGLEEIDIANLKVNHDNNFPLWMDGRDNDSVERLAAAGLIKKNKDFTKITYTKAGTAAGNTLKQDDVLPLGLLKQQTMDRDEESIYGQSLVKYSYRGTSVISNSSFGDKWKFGLMEFNAKSFDPAEKNIYNITDLASSLDKKSKKFKDQIDSVLKSAKNADTEIMAAGYREELHKLIMRADTDKGPIFIEVSNNYYNYFTKKYGNDIKFITDSSEFDNVPKGNLGIDINVAVVKGDQIIGAIPNAFYVASPTENEKIDKQLKAAYA